jgi:hypothetical protein
LTGPLVSKPLNRLSDGARTGPENTMTRSAVVSSSISFSWSPQLSTPFAARLNLPPVGSSSLYGTCPHCPFAYLQMTPQATSVSSNKMPSVEAPGL